MADSFTRSEERRIARALRAGDTPTCPRCGTPLDARPVPPRDDVSYVRDRIWLTCPSCRRGVVLDRREKA